ncbi:MAG: GNAT family N-acetyltransferase [Spartobacteria bacterium]|nr:GNAT family N-acetyltransferase [Spartobacteria bacterium]
MTLIIRKIEECDREAIFTWVAGLGWNPGIHDGDCLMATDPDGMFLAELNGAPVGCATAIAYDATFGFVGALVVDPALRGRAQSFMRRIYHHVNAYMGNRCVGLDAMPITQKFFAGTGSIPAYRHIRYDGILPGGDMSSDIVPLATVPFADVLTYDAACFPACRERFLRHWLDTYGAGGFACLRHGSLVGFGILRQALRGYRVGPLLADDVEAAEQILHAMSIISGDSPVALDVPEPNATAISMAERMGLKRGFDTMRMYTKAIPERPLERIFGIASYEFG